MSTKKDSAEVIGAGLAGVEAAWALAERGVRVRLFEMKPKKYSPAHRYPGFAELVCSNSLKASRPETAAGLLKAEMRLLGSLTLRCAEEVAVPAGGALAVDRLLFSDAVTEAIRAHPLITVCEGEEVTGVPEGPAVVATGPLTSGALAESIRRLCGRDCLSFFDAAAPIVMAESIDYGEVFFAARWGRGGDDYLNCPMDRERYDRFYGALIDAETVRLHEFETARPAVYEGCMPVETLARRGRDALRFGPMRPVGLTDPRTGKRPWAVVQLRRENREGTLYNLVGFQTNLRFPEQKRVFSLIPGLGNAEFARYGVMHRNTFLDSPRLLDRTFRLRGERPLYFAGQLTGVEGYMESAASGILAGINLARELRGEEPLLLPEVTMTGALARYIGDESIRDFQPMGANMGLLPALPGRIKGKQERYGALSGRALQALSRILEDTAL